MNADQLQHKFNGAMTGTAIGDGLGAGFEGLQGFEVDQIHAVGERRTVLRYTDDTHMMIGVAESLIACGGFDGAHMTQTFVRNFNREPFRGYGPGPPRIFSLIEAGESWENAAEKIYPGGSYGNGAAMRVAPVGLLYYDDASTVKAVAFQSARITHAHALGKEGAALQACAVALATNSDPDRPLDTERFLHSLNDSVEEDVFLEKLDSIPALLADADPEKVISMLGNGIEAFTAVPAAVFSFLVYPDAFEAAVVFAIRLGGDTDTIGAMAGAISGARLGVDAIPGKWRHKLENRRYIEPLAKALWELKTG